MTWNEKLTEFLVGRRLKADHLPTEHLGRERFSFWGEEAGFSAGDIHCHRAYQIFIEKDDDNVITDAFPVIEGELLSPCSGFAYEELDEFDYPVILQWCQEHTDP